MRRCVWSRNIKNRCSTYIYIYIYIYIYDISSLRVKRTARHFNTAIKILISTEDREIISGNYWTTFQPIPRNFVISTRDYDTSTSGNVPDMNLVHIVPTRSAQSDWFLQNRCIRLTVAPINSGSLVPPIPLPGVLRISLTPQDDCHFYHLAIYPLAIFVSRSMLQSVHVKRPITYITISKYNNTQH